MVDLTQDEISALESSVNRIAAFLRLATTPDPVRLWLAVGDIEIVGDVFDPAGARYRGLGELVDVPTFNQVINGRAERLRLALSGVTPEMLFAFITNDINAVKHVACVIGLGIMSQSWRLLGSIHWLWRGEVDFADFNEEVSANPNEPSIRVIGLSVGGLMTGRRRAGLAYWTNYDQQRLYPTDRFCERVNTMTEFEKGWPIL